MRGRLQDFLFCPTTRKEERYSAESHHTDCISGKCDWHEPAHASHSADVLFSVAAVNDRTRAEKQQRLEKTVRQQMHYPCGNPTCAERNHHQAKLRNSRIREDTFDIGLCYGD